MNPQSNEATTSKHDKPQVAHTLGPWSVAEGSLLVKGGTSIGGDRLYVANCIISEEYRSHEESLANARLIAAAPELLEACIIARAHLGFGDCTLDNVRRICDEAIAKATRGEV